MILDLMSTLVAMVMKR